MVKPWDSGPDWISSFLTFRAGPPPPKSKNSSQTVDLFKWWVPPNWLIENLESTEAWIWFPIYIWCPILGMSVLKSADKEKPQKVGAVSRGRHSPNDQRVYFHRFWNVCHWPSGNLLHSYWSHGHLVRWFTIVQWWMFHSKLLNYGRDTISNTIGYYSHHCHQRP